MWARSALSTFAEHLPAPQRPDSAKRILPFQGPSRVSFQRPISSTFILPRTAPGNFSCHSVAPSVVPVQGIRPRGLCKGSLPARNRGQEARAASSQRCAGAKCCLSAPRPHPAAAYAECSKTPLPGPPLDSRGRSPVAINSLHREPCTAALVCTET